MSEREVGGLETGCMDTSPRRCPDCHQVPQPPLWVVVEAPAERYCNCVPREVPRGMDYDYETA